jgi:hypothetical protein
MPEADIIALSESGRGPCGGRMMRPCQVLAEDLKALADMAHAKFLRVRLAVDLIAAGVIVLAIGVVAAAAA